MESRKICKVIREIFALTPALQVRRLRRGLAVLQALAKSAPGDRVRRQAERCLKDLGHERLVTKSRRSGRSLSSPL